MVWILSDSMSERSARARSAQLLLTNEPFYQVIKMVQSHQPR